MSEIKILKSKSFRKPKTKTTLMKKPVITLSSLVPLTTQLKLQKTIQQEMEQYAKKAAQNRKNKFKKSKQKNKNQKVPNKKEIIVRKYRIYNTVDKFGKKYKKNKALTTASSSSAGRVVAVKGGAGIGEKKLPFISLSASQINPIIPPKSLVVLLRSKRQKDRIPYSKSFIDYKYTNLLLRFIGNGCKILPRRLTKLTSRQQRYIAKAIKTARIMGLLPFVSKHKKAHNKH